MPSFEQVQAGILDLHARYTDAVWRADADAFAACFTHDGEWRISGRIMCGRGEIRDTIAAILDNFVAVLFTYRTPIIDIAGGQVSARCYVDERCAWKNGERNISIGRYYERFAQQDGRWLFQWRLFQMLYRGPADLSGEYFDQPDYGPPPGMPPLDAEPKALASALRWGVAKPEV